MFKRFTCILSLFIFGFSMIGINYAHATEVPSASASASASAQSSATATPRIPTPTTTETTLGSTAKSAILVEQSTGKVLFEKAADERLPIASVTKTMTMLLAMEALDSGVISLETMLTCSEFAASMGGSQVFLEPNEKMSFNDALKAVAVASGNDAAVMIAEHLGGTEAEFVRQMNARAVDLGAQNTHFINCNGLDEGTEAFSSARDVALISAELLQHGKIIEYLTIWMDSLRGGEFGLANTNKLIHSYDGANGIKTGSTSDALYCLSAAAKRGDLQLIAVILGAPSTAERFSIATGILDYGFANFALLPADAGGGLPSIKVEKGNIAEIQLEAAGNGGMVVPKAKVGQVKAEAVLPQKAIMAPIAAGTVIGKMQYKIGEEIVGELELISGAAVAKIGFWESFFGTIKSFF